MGIAKSMAEALNMFTLGILFDIEKMDNYGIDSWKIFFRSVGIENLADLRDSYLYEGDTIKTLNKEENVYCIAVQSVSKSLLNRIREVLEQYGEYKSVAATPMFLEDERATMELLMDAGRIDFYGNVTGENTRWPAQALDSVRNEEVKPESRQKFIENENKELYNYVNSHNAKELERIRKNNKLEFQRNHVGPPPTYTPKSWKFWKKPKNPIEDNLFQLKSHLEDENFIFAQYFVDELLEMGCNDKKFIKLKRQIEIETTKIQDDKEDLSHSNPDVRMEAITKLAKNKRIVEEVIPLIIPMLKDEDKMVRLRATEALAYLTDEDFGENIGKWQQWWKKNKPEPEEDSGFKAFIKKEQELKKGQAHLTAKKNA